MSYFNHAFHKSFIATKATASPSGTPGEANAQAGVTNGILVTTGIHVSNLKSTAAAEGYQLGPGVVGMFDAKTNLSVLGANVTSNCSPFYIAAASIKLNDKQGPFHGGYQESNKSKLINPAYINKVWYSNGTAGSQAIVEIGGTLNNNGGTLAEVASLNATTLDGGTGYTTATDVATTSDGSGTGLTVDITAVEGVITVVAIADPGLGYEVGDTITITGGNANATIDVLTVDANDGCIKEFLCGETYYLRVDVKGIPALRFANHNLYQTLQADGGCCDDPSVPTAIDPISIYLQWATQIAENNYFKNFINPILVANGESYAYNAELAVAAGLASTAIYSAAPTTTVSAGLILMGAYVDTSFGDCTFQTTDYYGKEPIQIYASESDINGDPCTFGGVCVVERCPGIQANGLGEQKVRELILSESYLQNFVANDLRIREITQGTRAYEVLDRTALYDAVYIQHSVPRFNNASSVFDNDQYVLEVVMPQNAATTLVTQLNTITAACSPAEAAIDYSNTVTCSFTLPTQA